MSRLQRRIKHDIKECRLIASNNRNKENIWYFPDPVNICHGYGLVIGGHCTPYVIELCIPDTYPYKAPTVTILGQPDTVSHILAILWCSTMTIRDILKQYQRTLHGNYYGLQDALTHNIPSLPIPDTIRLEILYTIKTYCRTHYDDLLPAHNKAMLEWFKDTFKPKIKLSLRALNK